MSIADDLWEKTAGEYIDERLALIHAKDFTEAITEAMKLQRKMCAEAAEGANVELLNSEYDELRKAILTARPEEFKE